MDRPPDLDFIGKSFNAQKYWFARDVWEAQNPEDRGFSNLPGNVREMVQRQRILNRPLNVCWAFLRMTIGLPIELVIKILLPQNWKIWVPRPPPIRPMIIPVDRIGNTILDRMPAYPYARSGSRRNIN
jgi:hypothetical protein